MTPEEQAAADAASAAGKTGESGAAAPQAGEHLRARIDPATGTTQTVVQRDDVLLIPDEVQKAHWPEVLVAINQAT